MLELFPCRDDTPMNFYKSRDKGSLNTPMQCHKTLTQPAEGVGPSTPHDYYCNCWPLDWTFFCLSKQNTLLNYRTNLYAGRSLPIYCPSHISRATLELQGTTSNICFTPANNFLQPFFLKTISWRYIYPLSYAFLIYAIPTGGEKMETDFWAIWWQTGISLLCSETGWGFLVWE